jgi:hypothetical protein
LNLGHFINSKITTTDAEIRKLIRAPASICAIIGPTFTLRHSYTHVDHQREVPAPKLRKAHATSQARPARLGAARLIFKGYEGQAANQDK